MCRATSSADHPILMDRTPYGVAPYGADAYRTSLGPSGNPKFAAANFIFVYQDARGRYESEGAFTEMTPHKDVKKGTADVDESTDTYDTIDWLLKNVPHNNRRVGIYGTSYPGFYTTASCIDPHPALKACEPGAPMTDLWMGDDLFHNGAFMLGANFDFYQGLRAHAAQPEPRPRSHDTIARTTAATPTSSSSTWVRSGRARASRCRRKRRRCGTSSCTTRATTTTGRRATSVVTRRKCRRCSRLADTTTPKISPDRGGRFAESKSWRPEQTITSRSVRGRTAVGRAATATRMARFAGRRRPVRGFATRSSCRSSCTTSRTSRMPSLPKVLVYRTGGERWDRYDAWPPKNANARSLYLQPGGKLGWEKPAGRRKGVRRIRERSGESGSGRRPREWQRYAARLHDGRSTFRLEAAGRDRRSRPIRSPRT